MVCFGYLKKIVIFRVPNTVGENESPLSYECHLKKEKKEKNDVINNFN